MYAEKGTGGEVGSGMRRSRVEANSRYVVETNAPFLVSPKTSTMFSARLYTLIGIAISITLDHQTENMSYLSLYFQPIPRVVPDTQSLYLYISISISISIYLYSINSEKKFFKLELRCTKWNTSSLIDNTRIAGICMVHLED